MTVAQTPQNEIKKRAKRVKSYGKNNARVAYGFLLPYMLIFCTFTVLPVLISIFFSFTYYNILETPQFIGFDNYVRLILHDENFLLALKNTMFFAIITGPAGYLISLLAAWMINELSSKLRAILVLLFYAPSISGNVYMIWKLIFSSDSYGYANSILMSLGLITEPVLWLSDPTYIMGIVILVALWMSLGTSFLSFIAGLQGIDKSQYESGAIDGIKNRWQELWYITLPNLKPQLMFGAVLAITSSFGVYDIAVGMAGFPSVQYAAHTIVAHLVDYGNIRFEMGYASAIATVLFIIMVGCNKLVNVFIKKIGT